MVQLRSGRRVENEEIPSMSVARVDTSRGRTLERLATPSPTVPSLSRIREYFIPAKGHYRHESQGQRHHRYDSSYGHHGGGQHEAGMYEWGHQPEFQFQPGPTSSSYGEASSSSQSQQPFTPKGIQRGMNELATSLFGYSAYAGYVHPMYGYEGQQPDNKREGSSNYWPQ